MSNKEQELELLRLKLKILEMEKEKMLLSRGTVNMVAEDNEPVPVASPTGMKSSYITREQLDSLTPGELFILAQKRGVSIEKIFPL